MKPLSAIREQAQALYADAIKMLVTDERFIVDDIEREIKLAAPRVLRQRLQPPRDHLEGDSKRVRRP